MFSSKNDLDKLERLQERCINICTRTYGKDNINKFRTTYKLPTLERRRTCHLNNFMFKRNENIEIIDNNDDMVVTRSMSSKKFIVNKPNIETYKRSINYSGAVCWNKLPNNTKNIDLFEIFKFNQKKEMLAFK